MVHERSMRVDSYQHRAKPSKQPTYERTWVDAGDALTSKEGDKGQNLTVKYLTIYTSEGAYKQGVL